MYGNPVKDKKKYTVYTGTIGPDYSTYNGCIIDDIRVGVIYFTTPDHVKRACHGQWEYEEEK